MANKLRKVLALIMALSLCMSLLSVTAIAAGEGESGESGSPTTREVETESGTVDVTMTESSPKANEDGSTTTTWEGQGSIESGNVKIDVEIKGSETTTESTISNDNETTISGSTTGQETTTIIQEGETETGKNFPEDGISVDTGDLSRENPTVAEERELETYQKSDEDEVDNQVQDGNGTITYTIPVKDAEGHAIGTKTLIETYENGKLTRTETKTSTGKEVGKPTVVEGSKESGSYTESSTTTEKFDKTTDTELPRFGHCGDGGDNWYR